ncbi:MAG: ABC transporter ATP-binding protein [Oscillospiraceae bacterium]|nr:ABC transporter ATP-binding protein [Oscillospiraceae bacterium]
MKIEKSRKEKQKYNLLSNISYALKNIWRWDKAFYLYFIPSIPFSILLPLVEIYYPKIIIDAVEGKQSIPTIIMIVMIIGAMMLFINLINSFCGSRLAMRQYNFSTMYQHEITEKFMRTDFSNTDNPKINLKYSLVMNDACSGQCAPEFIWRSLRVFLCNTLGVFTYGSIITMMSPLILCLLFASAAITYFVSRWQRNYSEKHKDSWTAIDRKIGYLSGFSSKFEYAKDIRIYGMLNWLNGLLNGFQEERFSWTKKMNIRSFIGVCISTVLTLLRDGAAYAVLIVMIINNKISVGDFVFYFGAITGFSVWLNNIVDNVNDIVAKSIKISYYREYFNIKENYNHAQGCSLPTLEELPVDIEFCNVSYQYPSTEENKYTLKNINIKIDKGERIAIVGENGAGKTTLIKLLCGFYFPTEGIIKINGKSVSEYNIEEYYTLFSAVFQDMYLLPVSISEFISSSDTVIDRDKVEKVIKKAGLLKKINSLPKSIDSRLMKGVFDDSIELSGGEKQKLMLARALYKNSPVIILDEPTAALDPIAENELYLKYNELTKHKTSIYISHRLASTRFCDRIILVDNGEIVESGSHDELMKRGGKYAYMFDLQSHYYKETADNA